jgi:hypothetical protein
LKFCENYQNLTQGTEGSIYWLKNDADRLAWHKVAMNVVSAKCNKANCNKMLLCLFYACTRRIKKETEQIFDKIRTDNFPKLMT